MARHRVTCITKSTPNGTHEHITGIGLSDGARWTKQQAIGFLATSGNSLYVVGTGISAEVGVVKDGPGAPYLRTHADGKWTDNLLALPAC
jgi:hypothetical protein